MYSERENQIVDPGGEFDSAKVYARLIDEFFVKNRSWSPADFAEFSFSKIEDYRGVGGGDHLFFIFQNQADKTCLRPYII